MDLEEVCEKLVFHWADYLIIALFFVFTMALGLIIGFRDRKKSSSKDILLGGGDMHWIPTALSMQASFLSAVTLLSTPTEIYSFGTMYAYFGLTYITALPIAAYMFMPTFYRLRLVSAYEYLEIRFNKVVRLAASVTFSIMAILYLSVVLYTPALALAQVSSLGVQVSIAICGAVCTFYTVIGGMKATLWNDFFQMLMVIAGLLMVIIIGSERFGGMGIVWEINMNGSRIEFDDFNLDPTERTTFWTQIIGGTTIHVAMYASSQSVIQKFLSVRSLKLAQRAVWGAVVTSVLIFILVIIIGLIMYAYYVGCDPVTAGLVESNDQLVPLFIMDLMVGLPGLPGLFIASAFSAALSSVSGSLNALSAVFLIDFISPAYKKKTGKILSESSSAIITRVLILIFGLVTIFLGLAAKYFGALVLQIALSIFGFIGGPLTGTIALGLFFPFVNSWGALSGLIVSLVISSWIAVGSLIHNDIPLPKLPMSAEGCPLCDFNNYTTLSYVTNMYSSSTTPVPDGSDDILWVYKISHMYYGIISISVAFIVGIVVSLLTGRAKDTDAKLTFSWGNECCCYCPSGCRECLMCGAIQTPDDDIAEKLVISSKSSYSSNGKSHHVECTVLPKDVAYEHKISLSDENLQKKSSDNNISCDSARTNEESSTKDSTSTDSSDSSLSKDSGLSTAHKLREDLTKF